MDQKIRSERDLDIRKLSTMENQCRKCFKPCFNATELTKHMLKHKTFTCPVKACSYAFRFETFTELRNHQRVFHSKEKIYSQQTRDTHSLQKALPSLGSKTPKKAKEKTVKTQESKNVPTSTMYLDTVLVGIDVSIDNTFDSKVDFTPDSIDIKSEVPMKTATDTEDSTISLISSKNEDTEDSRSPEPVNTDHSKTKVGQFTCPTCRLQFASEEVLELHKPLHSQDNFCHKCGSAFKAKVPAFYHPLCPCAKPGINLIEDLLPGNRYTFKCEECKRLFENKNQLEPHRQIHSGMCHFSYRASNPTNTGDLIWHNLNDPDIFKCTMCSKTFRSSYNLKLHGKEHFKCKLCARTFVSLKNLEKHEAKEREAMKISNVSTSVPKDPSQIAVDQFLKECQGITSESVVSQVAEDGQVVEFHSEAVDQFLRECQAICEPTKDENMSF